MRTVSIVLLLALLFCAGCSYVTPKDAQYFDWSADNAATYHSKIVDDANIPIDVRNWIAFEARARAVESSWAHGKAPLATPKTAK